MGFSQSTYHAFGVHVPVNRYRTGNISSECDWLDAVIKHTPELAGSDLGYLTAGGYDRDMLFIVVSESDEQLEVEVGKFMALASRDVTGRAKQVEMLAEAAGYTNLAEPGWLIIPDVS